MSLLTFLRGDSKPKGGVFGFLRDTGESIVNPAYKVANDVRSVGSYIEGGPQAAKNVLQPGGGFGHQGGVLDGGELANDAVLFNKKNLAKVAGTGLSIGSNLAIPGEAAALKGATLGGKVALGSGLGALIGGTGSLGSQLAEKGSATARATAQGAAGGALLGGATPLLGEAVSKAIGTRTTSAAEKAVETPRLGPEKRLALENYQNVLSGADKVSGKALADLMTTVRQIGNEHGIDLTNASKADKMDAIGQLLDKFGSQIPTKKLSFLGDESGHIQVPGREEPPLESALPQNPVDQAGSSGTSIAPALKEGEIATPEIRQALDLATQKTDTAAVNIDQNAKNFKGLAGDIRGAFSGEVNAQKQSAANLADVLKRAAPDEQHGIFWYREAGGNLSKLQEWVNNPKLAEVRPDIEQAMNLSPQAKEVSTALDEYYKKIGQNAYEQGSLKNVMSDYGNKRLYQQPETSKGIGGTLNKYTASAKERVYPDVVTAIEHGHIPASTNASDVAAVHGAELARANTTRNLADSMHEAKIGRYFSSGDVPQGWTKIDALSKTGAFLDKEGVPHSSTQVFAAPEQLAKGLKAITEPDYLANVDSLRGIAKYQGLVKTVDLSFSLFHHITEAAQALYQTKGGVDLLRHADDILSLKNPDFAVLENDFVKHTGVTTKVSGVQDIMRGLVGNEEKGVYGKITNAPGVKQVLDLAEKSANLLFDKGQRWLKVNDYGIKITDWVAKHPNATNEEVAAAKAGFGREINAAYGGLNWQAIGVTKTQQSILRNILFAPDWTVSNIELARQALPNFIGKVGGTASASARAHLFTAVAGGFVATEALNKAITGHFSNENPKGHKYEVQVAPNTYVSVFRGGIGDITKLAGNIQDRGLAQGTAQFAQGKTTPLVRTTLGLASGSQFTGQPITNKNDTFAQKLVGEAKYIGQSAAPVPLGISATAKYVADTKKTGQETNPLVAATLGSGVGRYSKTSNGLSDRQQAFVQNLAKSGAPKVQQEAATQFFLTLKTTSQDRTKTDKAITAALAKGDVAGAQKAAHDYNLKLSQSFKGWVNKYKQYSNRELEKAYNGNKINLSSASIKARLKSIKSNPLYNPTIGGQ